MMTDVEFEEFIGSQVEIIDEVLTDKEIDISARPLIAAECFVKKCIVSVGGKSPDDYMGEYWFKFIINPVIKWYKAKYGSIVTAKRNKVSRGIVIYRGVFYELKVPMMVVVPKEELRHFIFPKEILSFEKEFDFILNPPNLINGSPEAEKITNAIRNVVNFTRGISNNIGTAQFQNDRCKELSDGIQTHVQKAVADMLSGENSRYLNSYWELHLAIEKSMKVLICQLNGTLLTTHDLAKLRKLLDEKKPGLVCQKALDKLPGHKQVINFRYGSGPNQRKTDIYANYLRALALIENLTKHFERKIIANNAVLILRTLDWQK